MPRPCPSCRPGRRCDKCREVHRAYMRAWRKTSGVEPVSATAAPSDAGREVPPPSASRPAPNRKIRKPNRLASSDSYLAIVAAAPEPSGDELTCEHCLERFPSRRQRKAHNCVPFTRMKPAYVPPPPTVEVVIRHPRYRGGEVA